LGFLVVGFSSWLIGLYGPEFQGGRTVLALMACVTIMYIASSTVGQALISAGRMWTALLMNLGWASIFLPLAAYWAPSMGAVGLAQAYFISYACFTIALLIYIGVKFGRIGVQYSSHLVLLTCMTFILALSIGKLPDKLVITLSLLCSIITIAWLWRLLPQEMKQRIIGLVPFCVTSS
jgi:O-antigen/teichoic acid export membrane protein